MDTSIPLMTEEPKKKYKTVKIKVKDVFDKKNIPSKTANKVIAKKKIVL